MDPSMPMDESAWLARWWHRLPDGRIQCDLCPRECKLHEGQRGACFVRARRADALVLTTYGRSSGFCVDPIEKKPLYHFLPGSAVLSFGTAGCNLACQFCQNWDISKARDTDRLMDRAMPQTIAEAAQQTGCASVAFTYNDPVIFAEYAIDAAIACRERGIRTVAVTAGYIHAQPRRNFFAAMDAANIDLKAFSDDFYFRLTGARLRPVLDTLAYVRHETAVWLEITTLLIPGHNDSDAELTALARWIMDELGPDVPLHLTAFHPDYRMCDVAPTPVATLQRARRIAREQGLLHVYTGNVPDGEGATTWCARCGSALIERDGYRIRRYRLQAGGHCPQCGESLVGHFERDAASFRQAWGGRRQPLWLAT
ncbi:AmmeMemoRadiSam system radical SAM enzyme [Tepidimonas charontis]|uniref:AmmeMemoRadiSam system radical SAM enzyme n=1 Tax=Tepidimonas charontis TaxID=2267262 RepID=A0A554XEF7_9BURK|nr:AmmeMemoRadiSam system radical SAM enzyme [Tepidimonas charontis]TSE34228.1 AmmeMemoRadiSam system radical SAM enzyme [Tepidimonas charontis]